MDKNKEDAEKEKNKERCVLVKRSRDCQAQVNSNAQKIVKLRVLYPHTTKHSGAPIILMKISVF
ncbi:hypothetical protein [Negativicoccus succinicivorans]|uniref:hypothetical protein n=1 Tax=Negativicoccus succinicivorans TaxID=620903 RepID=UPI0029018FFB|nr:hypothetical protein [Negativicoccus succinicivorans]MDU2417825.1 hypothetical protein [Negativicoccus succinicivorans]